MTSNSLTDALRETLALFDDRVAPRTTSEIANELDLGRRSTYDRLERLVAQDRLRTKKVGANARVWWRPPADDGLDGGDDQPQFDSFVDAVEEYAIFLLNPDGYVRSWNPGAEEIKGYAEEEIVGEHFSTFYPPKQRDAGVPERNLSQAARDGSVEDEGWRVRADGTEFWANVTMTAIRDDEGELEGFAKVTRDMTDRRERERLLRRERDLVERILETIPVGLGVVSATGELIRTNERAKALLGGAAKEGSEIEGRRIYDANGDLVPPKERPSARVFETGEPVHDWRCQIDGADGGRRWLTVNAAPLESEDSNVEGVVVAGDDVTQLKTQTERLQRQHDQVSNELEEVFERIDDGFYALDGNRRFVHLNDRAADAFGGATGEFIGEHIRDALDLGPKAEAAFDEALETDESVTFEEYYEPAEMWLETHVYPSETGLSVYFRDITDRKHRQQELERYRTLVETMSEGVYTVDADGYFTLVNDQYAAMVGRSKDDLLGAHISTAIDDESTLEQVSRLEAELIDGERDSATLKAELQRPNGDPWTGEATFTVAATDGSHERIGVVRDITDQRAHERRLEQYENLVETVWDGVYALDEDERFALVNEAFCDLVGYGREELLGEHSTLVTSEAVNEAANHLEAAVLAGESDVGVIELGIETADGDTVPVETRFGPFEYGDGHIGRCGVTRDVSERKERERELEIYETIVSTMQDGVYVLDDGFEFVKVNDAYVEMTGYDCDELVGTHCSLVVDDEVTAESARQLEEMLAGAVDSGTIEADIQRADGTTLRAESRFTAIGGDRGKHTRKVGVVRDVSERAEREQALERQRERLAALNNLHNVVRNITERVIEQSTREEIERTVCEHLAASESYAFAWTGDIDTATETVTLRTEAGVEGYLDNRTISIDPDDERGQGPTSRALRTGKVQIMRDSDAGRQHDAGHERIEQYGFESNAAIPIVHEDTVYGVLNVYADRPDAFGGDEQVIISRIGEIAGHAIAAAERKQALMSDELVELGFHMDGIIDELGVSMPAGGRITFDHAVPLENENFLVYGTATPDTVETVREVVDMVDYWESVEFRDGGDPRQFEHRMSDPPMLSTVASLGGYVEEAVISDGNLDLRIHLAPSVDVHRAIDAVETAYPTATLRRRQQITRAAADPHRMQRELLADLTEKQQAALEVAYHAGFFGWPRDASGGDVADSLGVTAPTFHQHLRKAQAKVFDSLLSAETPS